MKANNRTNERSNVVLIGPPGVGKSTVGVLLSKRLNYAFLDTDILIQSAERRRLQDILDELGVNGFIRLEEKYILDISVDHTVIATGGSVVYSQLSMASLGEKGSIIYLNLPYNILLERINDMDTRGVVKPRSQSFQEMYDERRRLYKQYADIEIDCLGMSHDEVVAAIIQRLDWDGQ